MALLRPELLSAKYRYVSRASYLIFILLIVGTYSHAQESADFARFQPSPLAATPVDAENQLRQLKQAFLTLAMDHEAQVAASGWTTSDGSMGEDVMVFSGLQLEKLRPVLRRNRFGVETTELIYAAHASLDACNSKSVRPQRLGVVISSTPGGNPDIQNMARDAGRLLHANIHDAFTEGKLTSISTIVDARSSREDGMSAYQRYMTAAPASVADMQLLVQISALDDRSIVQTFGLFERVRSGKTLNLQLSLVSREGVVFSQEHSVLLGSSRQHRVNQLAWLELPEAAKKDLAMWIHSALVKLNQAVFCHAESALALGMERGQITLVGGRDAGIYVGQRMAILPKGSTLRVRGLQQSLGVVGLAEVVRVGPRTSALEIYAGPRHTDLADMTAIPVSALSL